MRIKKMSKIKKLIQEPKFIFDKLNGVKYAYGLYCRSFKKIVSVPRMVIDIGANSGKFAKASNYYFPDALLIMFEPIIEYGIKLGKYGTVYSMALGNKNGFCKFNYTKNNSGKSSILEKMDEFDDIIKRDVQISSFESLNIKIQKPCIVKIDVEGYELNVLKGFGDKIKDIDAILLEYHGAIIRKNQTKLGELMNFMDSKGFSNFLQLYPRFKRGGLSCDLLFWRTT